MAMLPEKTKCPICDREWENGCEQSICIEIHGQCIPCHFRDNTPEGRTHEEAQTQLGEISNKRRALDGMLKTGYAA